VIYIEGMVGPICIEGETDTYIYRVVFEALRDTAMSAEESSGLIASTTARHLGGAAVLNP